MAGAQIPQDTELEVATKYTLLGALVRTHWASSVVSYAYSLAMTATDSARKLGIT